MNDNIAIKKAEKIALFSCFLQLLFFVLTFFISFWGSTSIKVQSAFFMMGIAIWFLSYLHLRQKRLASEEEDAEKEYASNTKHTLFDEADQLDPLSARNRFEIFQIWIIPISSCILALGFISLSIYHLTLIMDGATEEIIKAPLTAAFLGGFAFFSLLIAKYSLGMSQQKNLQILRAGGSYLFSNATTSFLCCIAVTLSHTGFHNIDLYVSYIIISIMGLIGIEILFNLLLDFYRPRISNEEARVSFDSRFLEISSGSRGFLKTIAQMFDYQFGFKVSETWFYQFMEKAIAPLLLFQIFSLYLLNCIVFVTPSKEVIIERFGTPHRIYSPGFHVKLPWPIEKAIHVDVKKAHHMIVGQFGEEEDDHHDEEGKVDEYGEKISSPRIFSERHHSDSDFFLIANEVNDNDEKSVPVNMMVVRAALTYIISDIHAYTYNHQNPEMLIDSLYNKVMTRYFASTSLENLIGKKRIETSKKLKELIQIECNNKKLGINILSGSLLAVHPPFYVAKNFENVISALEEKETRIIAAKTYQKKIKEEVEASVHKILLKAKAQKMEKTKLTMAKANMFLNKIKVYNKDKDIFLLRQYLRALEENLKNRRIIISNVKNAKQVDSLNLEDSGMSIMDYDIATPGEDNEEDN